MLIDGKLVEGQAGTFANINPATEEVLGQVADASTADMHRAIDAARRAFDETDWSTNRAFRKRCLEQLQDALEAEQEQLREELIAEVGARGWSPTARSSTCRWPMPCSYPAKLIDEYPWETDLGDAMVELTGQMTTRQIWQEPVGVVGAIVPWNFPFEVTIHKLGQALATGNTVVLKPAPDTPFNATRLGRLVAEHTDIPAGVRQRRHRVRPPGRRGAHAVAQGRPDLLHRLDRRGQADHGEGRGHHEAPVPRARRQVGHHRPRRRRLRRGHADRPRGVHARRPGLRHPDPDAAAPVPLRRGRRAAEGASTRTVASVTRSDPTRLMRPGDLAPSSATACIGYIEKGIEEGATLARRRPGPPAGLDRRASTSSRRCSSTSTTR